MGRNIGDGGAGQRGYNYKYFKYYYIPTLKEIDKNQSAKRWLNGEGEDYKKYLCMNCL